MSEWSYINGVITISPLGRTQAEKRYILDTVLEHLPVVSGSERDMSIYVIQKEGHDMSSSCDEFGQRTDNLISSFGYGNIHTRRGWHEVQTEYLVVVDAALRDRDFETTKRNFIKWLTRLAKRVLVINVMVQISGWDSKAMKIFDDYEAFSDMFEMPSWGGWWGSGGKSDSHNWCEYLMWEHGEDDEMPIKLSEYMRLNRAQNGGGSGG